MAIALLNRKVKLELLFIPILTVCIIYFFENTLLFISLFICCSLTFYNRNNISSIFILFLCLKIAFFPLVLKILFYQIPNSNMRDPLITPFVVFFWVVSLFLLSLFLLKIRIRSPLIKLVCDNNSLLMSSYTFFVVGFFFKVLHTIFRPSLLDGGGTEGFGGFGNLTSVIYLGVIIYLYRFRNSQLKIKSDLVVMGLLMVALSLISNTKHEIITFFLTAFFSLIFFRIKITNKQKLIGTAALLITVIFITPVIQATRTLEFREANINRKIELLIEKKELNERKLLAGGYLPIENSLIDRLDILTETDVIINGINDYGIVGYYPLYDAVLKVIPSFLIGKKELASSSDRLLWDIKYRRRGIISRMTPGVIASVYAVGGLSFFVPLLITVVGVFLCSLILLVGNSLKYNILGVFILTKYALYFTEKPADALLSLLIRDLPLTLVQVWLVVTFLKIIGFNLFLKGRKIE